ncbi:alpha-amylase family glycosyl hydrolase [Leifsonia sp. EB41]|uniref:alpha-amylase family glycosyl hydrolase n=1 Tax=Leifsonia sp. EB41 TaxID=3156260 RepID=UPI003510F724
MSAPAAATQPPASQTAKPIQQSTDFQNLNGFMWFYNTYFDYKYTDITKKLDQFKASGIRVLGFFSPYDGDKTLCAGCDPLDFYSVSPQNGTIQDWKNLVAQAHKRGMKVVSYFVNIYMDENSQFFQNAQQQYAAGDRTSREVSSFTWTTNPNDPLPSLRMGPPWASSWEWSATAGAYYWKLWFGPGFNWDQPTSVAEVKRFEEFWLDTGIDGFMWDVGRLDSRFQEAAVTLPKTYTTNDKWLTFETSGATNAQALHAFGLNSWFNYSDQGNWTNDYTRLVNGQIDVNGLETQLENSDYARSVGATTHAWTIAADDDANLADHDYPSYPNDEVQRVQEAALLAGSGILYGSPMYDQYIRWSPTVRANWDRVLSTVNDNKALLPAASRDRVPAGPSATAFAERRTSEDGKQTALLVYNFSPTPATVTVDLTGTGIDLKQQPKDLYNGGKGAKIDGAAYSVSLPGYGFTMLEVKTT